MHAGGAERMCVNISNVLSANAYEVMLCTTRCGGPLEKAIDHGVKYFILHKKHFLDFGAFAKLLKLVRDNNIEIIHAHSSSVFWAVAVKLRLPAIRVIWHDHLGLRIYDRKKNFFYKLISKKIDAIIAVNNELADWSRRNMKVPRENIVLINNFPLLNTVKHNSNPEYFTIVCLANLLPPKDHGTLIRAVAQLSKQTLPKKLKVILAGSFNQSEYTSGIKSLIEELGLNEIISIAGSVEDTATLLASADCGVLTSVSEGLPVAILEYGMAGLPVVVTDVGQCAEVVGYGKYGYVVSPGDYESLAEKLHLLIENQSAGEKMGQMFKTRVLEKYGPGQFIIQYETILHKFNCR